MPEQNKSEVPGSPAFEEAFEEDRRYRVVPGLEDLLVPVESLVEDPANARRHPVRNLEAIKSSLAARGQHAPIVVQKAGMVVRVGNGRLRAARGLGWTHVAAVVVDEDDIAASARAIADNRASELAEWDGEALGEIIGELQSAGAIEGLAFDPAEISQIQGDFAVPGNGEELLGSIADGLIVRASVRVTCREGDQNAVEKALSAAVAESEAPGWCVRARRRQTTAETAERLREKTRRDIAAEKELT